MGPSLADHAAPVDGEDHRQILQADVVDDLIVGPLQEGRIDGHHRPEALGGQSGGKGHRVLLGDAHIEEAVRETAWRKR